MFCPFCKDDCNPACVFRCRPRAASPSMDNNPLTCVIASRFDAMNTDQHEQLDAILSAVETIG